MQAISFIGDKKKQLFAILILIQIIIILAMIGAGQFFSSIWSTIFRILLLSAAYFCINQNFAVFYSVFALIASFYLIDPIGLFLSAHGQSKSFIQNILCIITMILLLVASYLGYLYSKELLQSSVNSPNEQNQQYFTNPQQNTNYGATNYLYQNTINTQSHHQTQPTNNWQPFSGQGYNLH